MLFLVFLIVGLYSFLQRRSEHRRARASKPSAWRVPYVAVIHATPVEADSGIDSARQYPILRRFAHLRAHQRLSEEVVQGHRQPRQGRRSAGRNRYARSGCSSWRRPAPIWPRRRPTSSLPASPPSAIRTCSKATPSRKQEVDNFNGDYAAKQAMVQSAEANVKRLEDLESFKHVYAPFSGVITAAQRRYRHADQCRQRRHRQRGNVRPGADRSAARLRFRAADLRSLHSRGPEGLPAN